MPSTASRNSRGIASTTRATRAGQELAARLAAGEGDKVLIVDVRSHGYYDIGAERIAGSIRIEPNNLEEEIKNLPKDKDIYLYCT